MAFDILSILNGATLAETERTEEYQDIVLDYRDIVVTNHNKYSMVEIQELATGILMTGGLQAPTSSQHSGCSDPAGSRQGIRGALALIGTQEVFSSPAADTGGA